MASKPKPIPPRSGLLAYVVGLALGDGNLSANGRATRLRVTCDAKYPELAARIHRALVELFPFNKVSIIPKTDRCFDISCHSQHWESLVGWRVGKGSKIDQQVSVPDWVKSKPEYVIACLKGLLETDGSIYSDRGYPMVMFASAIPLLAENVAELMSSLGFSPHIYLITHGRAWLPIYRVRLSKRVQEFLSIVKPLKA